MTPRPRAARQAVADRAPASPTALSPGIRTPRHRWRTLHRRPSPAHQTPPAERPPIAIPLGANPPPAPAAPNADISPCADANLPWAYCALLTFVPRKAPFQSSAARVLPTRRRRINGRSVHALTSDDSDPNWAEDGPIVADSAPIWGVDRCRSNFKQFRAKSVRFGFQLAHFGPIWVHPTSAKLDPHSAKFGPGAGSMQAK